MRVLEAYLQFVVEAVSFFFFFLIFLFGGKTSWKWIYFNSVHSANTMEDALTSKKLFSVVQDKQYKLGWKQECSNKTEAYGKEISLQDFRAW